MNPPLLRGIATAVVLVAPFWVLVFLLRGPLADVLTVAAAFKWHWAAAFVVLAVVAWVLPRMDGEVARGMEKRETGR